MRKQIGRLRHNEKIGVLREKDRFGIHGKI
jgi:hypothetical protein